MANAPLIVPMVVDACVFSKQSSALDVRHMDYADGFNHYLSAEPAVLPDPPFITNNMLHERGVTVCWTLPYGLRTGRQDGQSIVFDPLPNRWLIVRVNNAQASAGPPPQWTSAAWVVASDYVQTVTGQLDTIARGINWAQPVEGNARFQPTRLGAAMTLDNFQELGAAARDQTPPLTAISGGTELFVSYEPFCKNIYSFRDPISEDFDTSATYSYFVVGWYAESDIDPIAGLAAESGGDVEAFLQELQDLERWTPTAAPAAVPPTALYFGSVGTVVWTPDHQPANVAPDRDDVLVVAAQSADEALDTFLTFASGNQNMPFARELEREGLTLGAAVRDTLQNFEDLGGLSRQSELTHQQAFGKLQNITEWSVREPQQTSEGGGGTDYPLPEAQQLTLALLNDKEEQLYTRMHQRIEKRAAVADTLWKAGRLKVLGEAVFPPELGSMSEYWTEIRRELGYEGNDDPATLTGMLKQIDADIATLQREITTLSETLRAELKELNPALDLNATSGERQWQALNPVVMMTTDKGALFPEGDDPQDLGEEELVVGTAVPADTSVILDIDGSDLTVPLGDVYDTLSFSGGDPASVLAQSAPGVASWLPALLGWSMMADPVIGPATSVWLGDQQASSDAIRSAMGAAQAETGLVFNPRTSVIWSQPWFPLFLEWRLDMTHFPMFKENGTVNWAFDGNDFRLTATATGDGSPYLLQGRSMLSSHLRRTVGSALYRLLSDFGVSEATIEELLADLDKWDFLTQRLTGLNETLSLRESALNRIGEETAMAMPGVSDPSVGPVPSPAPWDQASDYLNLPGVRQLSLPTIDDEWNPNATQHFRDMQGQQMVIDQLLILDRFGQSLHVAGKFATESTGRVLTDSTMAVSPTLRAERNLTLQGDRQLGTVVQVPPRILQPGRPVFRTREIETDENGTATGMQSPVIGFVMLNRYNKEIQVFSSHGRLLGAIHPGLGNTVVFEPLDDSLVSLAGLAETDPDLEAFVAAIVNGGEPGRYEDFSAQLDAAGWRIDPGSEEEAYLSVLTGEPLALIRASFNLTITGEPLVNPFRYFPFEKGLAGNGLPSFYDRPFPYLIGNPLDVDDGLVGYYLGSDFNAFYTPYDPEETTTTDYVRVVTAANAPTHSFAAPARDLVLLANPHGRVEIRTGILPAAFLQLPTRYWRSQIAAMNPTFTFGPLLTEIEKGNEGNLINVLLPQSNIEAGRLRWQLAGGDTVPVSPASPETATSPRPREFLWGRVLFELHGEEPEE